MLFNSFQYWIFFALVIVVVAFLRPFWRRFFIVAASYIFYSFWDARLCVLLLGSTLANYFLGLLIENSSAIHRKRMVTLAIVFNLILLGFFKYYNFFVASAASLLHANGALWALNIVLPVGISFFTFEGIAYCVDVYRKDIRAVRNFVDLALFISFFPHLVAGPIIRPENFFPQVYKDRGLEVNDIKWGICQIIKGLLKKVVFADFFAISADGYFSDPSHSAVAPAIGVLAFGLQIYFDFSGYTDIARGCAMLLGFKFPSNFERPYLSANIAEFWRRWHISLSTWLRDYLYIPLGGNRVQPFRVYINLLIVMGLGGLWHGASWNFMLWGLAHGVMLCVHRLWVRFGARSPIPSVLDPLVHATSIALTFVLVMLAWIPFRASSFSNSALILQQIFSNRVWSLAGTSSTYFALLAVSVAWCIVDRGRVVQTWFVERMRFAYAFLPIAVACIILQLFGQFGLEIPFIYFKF